MTAWPAPIGRDDKVRLDLNENNFVPRAKLERALASVPPDALTMYPEYERLQAALARYTGRSESEVLVCNGADQGIELVLRAFAARSGVILPVPTFSYYQHVARPIGVTLEKVPYGSDFELDTGRVLAGLSAGASGVVLVNPSNPLGTKLDRAEVRAILDAASRQNAFVLVDEVYFEFCGETCADWLDAYPQLIVLRSMSKGFGLAGARLGYVMSSPRNIEQLRKLRGPWDVNAIATYVALAALSDPSWLDFIPVVHEERRLLERKLQELGLQTWPSATNFVVAKGAPVKGIVRHLAEHGVLASDLDGYPDSFGLLKDCMRIGVPNAVHRERVYGLLAGGLNVHE